MVDRVVPLTPDLWPAFERLFGKNGACSGCWCIHWRVPRQDYIAWRGNKAKTFFKRRVMKGPPPGVVAFIGDEAVGWLQIGPRADAPQWNTPRRVSAPLKEGDAEDGSVWGATCFFIKSSARGRGVMDTLLEGGLKYARANGARVVEACPIDGRTGNVDAYVGLMPIFQRAKFKEVARRKANRPLMRLTVRKRR
ncbi:MAG: GNAT family N-acetyltransferase [Caulobacteraceae bacterium]